MVVIMDNIIKKKLINIIKKQMLLNQEEMLEDDDLDLVNDLNMDSIGLISVIVEIESQFDIVFSDEDLTIDKIKSMKWLIAKVEELCDGKNEGNQYTK